ncbi:MAG: bifunctional (p)ppGpp synthetase/guanosine-3',5'-bis(diphosphate) 3'-pyrophosphohydrolase [Pseudomonadota bacterium]
MIRQFELVEKVRAYNPNTDEALLNRAYVFGVKMHGGQTRASGEPYFNHPVEVAAILTDLRLDDATIVTALLHDTVEDTVATPEEIEASFGVEIAQLVDGVTKLSKLRLRSREEAQAENLRKLLVAMARDPRVLLVKLADRLHNMRTISHLRPDKRERIARETLDIFAPMAGRMGMQSIREELEDLCFAVLQPEARLSVMRRFVHLKKTTGENAAPAVIDELRAKLAKAEVEAEVSGREKRPYSIWRKMQTKQVGFEQLSDIIGFRVITQSEEDVYRALGVIHRAFPAVPGRFKDYLSHPKANGYRSIHTTVIGLRGARIEIQIRTQQMHEVAETGVAAHWAYRNGVRGANPFSVDPFRWLRDLVERVERAGPNDALPEEFLEEAKLEMSFDTIFCFTPKGDVVSLPQGATALDFAYAIHTGLGHTAVGAKINGVRAPLWTELRTGQSIEILQSDGQRPSPVWQTIAKTGRARAAIRRTLRNQEREEAADLGARLVGRVFERAEIAYSVKAMETAAQKLGLPDAESLLAEIGAARMTAAQALEAVYPEHAAAIQAGAPPPADPNRPQIVVNRRGAGHARGDAMRLPVAPCCRPLPGERIVALHEPNTGLRLHAIDCPSLEAHEDAMERWVDVAWAPDAAEAADHLATIELLLANEPGALGQICTLLGRSGANIDNLSFADRKPDYFKLRVELEVRDLRHLSNILTALNAQPTVAEAGRLRPAVAAGPGATRVEADAAETATEGGESEPGRILH